MASRRVQAIILRTRDYGESDRLITFFSARRGKLTGIAKGARRSKRRFVHTLEPLSLVVMNYVDRSASGLVRIESSELRNAFTALRSDIHRLAYASLGCEMILEMAPEREPNPELFSLLYHYLGHLERGADPETLALLFQIRLLSLSGYAPNLQSCARCGREPPASEQWFLSVSQSALLCPAHRQGSGLYPLSLGTLLLLRQAQHLPLAKLWRLKFHPQCRQEGRSLLINLIRHHLEKDLKSLKLLQQIGAPQPTSPSSS
jgi:DNA repair protein RecO (recombination protein O)